jgi:hypothetical protein
LAAKAALGAARPTRRAATRARPIRPSTSLGTVVERAARGRRDDRGEAGEPCEPAGKRYEPADERCAVAGRCDVAGRCGVADGRCGVAGRCGMADDRCGMADGRCDVAPARLRCMVCLLGCGGLATGSGDSGRKAKVRPVAGST